MKNLIEKQEKSFNEKVEKVQTFQSSSISNLNEITKDLKNEVANNKKLVIELLELFSDHYRNSTEKITNLENVRSYLRKRIDEIGKIQASQEILISKQKTEVDENTKALNESLKSDMELSEKIVHQENVIKFEVKEKIKELKNDLIKNIEDVAVVKHNLDMLYKLKIKPLKI